MNPLVRRLSFAVVGIAALLGSAAAGAAPRGKPTTPAPEPPKAGWAPHADLVGEGAGAWLSPGEWAKVTAALPALAAADPGVDTFAFRGPAHPAAPRRLDLGGLPGASERGVSLLVTYRGGVARGDVVLRVTTTAAGGGTSTRDLRAGDDLFALDAAGSSDSTVAVSVGAGRALSLVYLPPAAGLVLEVRAANADVAIFAVGVGRAAELPEAPPASLTGFPYPITIRAPGAPVPPAWRVPPNAGARGTLTLRDGHFAWPDGTRARFWGINLLNSANFPTHDVADQLAAQLAGSGFNLVRLHHADSPTAGGVASGRSKPSDPLFSEEGLDRFDYLVSRLQAAGIYVELEVATNRTFTAADGVNDPAPEVPNGHKLLPYFAPAWKKAYFDWARAWLGRTNRYTGRAYAHDPGVALVELTNENSLVMVWLTGGTERLPAVHRAELDRQWNEFLRTRYADDAAITKAWTGSVHPGLQPGESLGHVARWPAGQGAFSQYPDARVADLYDFHLGLETRFYAELAELVRGMGYTQPLVAGITYDTPAVAQTIGRYDVIDTHIEWDASASGTLRNDSLVGNPRSQGLIERFRTAQAGKPMMVSELNEAFPNDHQSEGPLLWASLGAVQDWDAIVWLNYTNGPVTEGPGAVQSFSELRFAAVKWAQMATASGLFRSGAVPAASGLFPLWRSPAAVRAETVEQKRPSFLELRDVSTLLRARYREAYGDEVPLPIPGAAPTAVGWWPGAERFVIQTPALEAVLADHSLRARAGRGEGAGPTTAPHLDPQLDGFAAVSLTCLEGELGACRAGWLTVAGQMENLGTRRIASGQVILDLGDGAVVVGRPGGAVRFAWPRTPDVRPVDAAGKVGTPVPVAADGAGWWSLPLATAGPVLGWQVR